MPDGTEPKRRSRGPAAGHLWAGQAGPEAPAPEPDPALPETPIYRSPKAEEPPPPAPERRSRIWPKAAAAGALAGLAVAAVAFVIAGPLSDDNGGSAKADPPVIAATSGTKSASSVGRIYAATSPAVASVLTGGGSGTGFLIKDDGTLVTNAHVVGEADDVRVKFGDDGRTVRGTVVGRDTSTDLAVVRVDSDDVDGIRPLGFADSDNVKVGDLAVAIGNPLGLPQTATAGIVSGVGREIQAPDGFQIDEVIQTDAPINPGNSGGPLLDERGRVIGVNSQIATAGAGSGNIGIGFAVPANTAREVVPQLEQGAAPKRPYLGVTTAPALGGGAEVQSIVPNSPADKAGLNKGDVIVGVDGERVREPADIAGAITDNEPGQEVGVELRRDGVTDDVSVRLGKPPDPVAAMSFGAPLFLAGLLLVPPALWLYVRHLRARRGQAARFANPALMPVVAPRRPGWRAHAPVAIYGIALTALLVGLARPQTTVAVPVEQATVMLATDVSGSMQAKDVRPDRLTAARDAASGMVKRLPDGARAGLVAFNHQARTVQSPTAQHERVVERIRALQSSGGTATGDAITAALNSIRAATPPRGKRPPAAILLLSDGESTRGRDELDAAREAARLKIPVYTVALGTANGTIQVERPGGQSGSYTQRVPPDRQAMRQIAQITKGKAFSTADAKELDQIYESLGSQVAMKDEEREVTAAFAGGALLLLLVGGAMSLRWFGRLP